MHTNILFPELYLFYEHMLTRLICTSAAKHEGSKLDP